MELEDRIKRIEDHCEKEGLGLYLGTVDFFTEEDSGWYTCTIGKDHVATEEGITLVVDAAEKYLGIDSNTKS